MRRVERQETSEWVALRCTQRPRRDELWLEADGEIDVASVDTLRAGLDDVLTAGFDQVVLDLNGVTFVDSTGLRAIIEAQRIADAVGIEFSVRPGPPQVRRLFDLTGTSQILRISAT